MKHIYYGIAALGFFGIVARQHHGEVFIRIQHITVEIEMFHGNGEYACLMGGRVLLFHFLCMQGESGCQQDGSKGENLFHISDLK